MTAISVTATDVAAVKVIEKHTGPAGATIAAGDVVYLIAASGKFGLADEDDSAPVNEPEGIAITGGVANETITIVKQGLVDLGDALDGLDYGAIVYLDATTPGDMNDADPGNTVVVGEVWPSWGATTADKLLRVDL